MKGLLSIFTTASTIAIAGSCIVLGVVITKVIKPALKASHSKEQSDCVASE
jgi:hypothetical protein